MNQQQTFLGEHPSGLEDEGELAYISMQFWSHIYPELPKSYSLAKVYDLLLAYQQGWKACKDFYKINV